MQKVKVHRYISGKRPEYAKSDSDDSSQDEDFMENRKSIVIGKVLNINQEQQMNASDDDENYNKNQSDDDSNDEIDDPRLRRLRTARSQNDDGERYRRHVHKPERASSSSESESSDDENVTNYEAAGPSSQRTRRISICSESDSGSNEASDDEIDRRRQLLKQKVMLQRDEELLQKEEEKTAVSEEESEEESSEYEDESEEDHEPRLKPQFVRKRDRITIIEKKEDLQRQKQLEIESKRALKERRKQTLKIVEESIEKDRKAAKEEKDPHLNDVATDDEHDDLEFEAWKLRELKRVKRERDEREALEKEKDDIEKFRNMTEEEREQESRKNPKKVTNKTSKGKYKFLQKYYHRGAFYLDKEEDVFKQDFSAPTLEDHFDKTVLPKVMQVKNFGRCGRTKYTHLVDQDTTKWDSPWISETATNEKFIKNRAAGMKQVFEKPSYRRKN